MEKVKIMIDGTGTVAAGAYGEIMINGSGKMEGAFTCDNLIVNGSAKAYAAFNVDRFFVKGSFKGEDNVKANILEVKGSFKGEKDVDVNTLIVDGMFKNEVGFLNAEYIEVNGKLKNEKEINVDRLVVNGILKAEDIVGKDVAILKEVQPVSFFRFDTSKKIISKAKTITCDNLYARALKCHKICSNDITLKGGCEIEFVECNGILRLDSSCIIKNVIGECEIIHEA